MKAALRSLAKSPGFTAIALLTLALGVGVNTAMFGVVRTLLLQPAPYPEPEHLVRVYRTSPQSRTWPHSLPDLEDLRARNPAFASLAAFQWWQFSLAEPGQPPERLRGVLASADLFATIGLQPALGRAFTAEEQQPGRDRVVVLTDAFWRDRYGADPDIIGRTVRIDGVPQTVIGVMPPGFAYPLFWGRLQAIRPLVISADWQHDRGTHWLGAIARLRPGLPLVSAQAGTSAIAASLAQQFPDTNAGTGLQLVPLHETALDQTGRDVSWLTLALSGFVLLIACANLANLQLARSSARARDFAVQAALGASRSRLVRQLLTESLVLALAGGVFGILLALWLNDLLSRRLDFVGGMPLPLSLDWSVLGFALLVAVGAGIGSGIAPALFVSRTDLNTARKSRSRGSTGDLSRHRVRRLLIVAEIAFALVLLAGAAFFIRGLQRFAARDPGWRTDGLLIGTLTLPNALPTDRYVTAEARLQFYERLLQRVSILPGVVNVALSSSVPIRGYEGSRKLAVEGRADPRPGLEPVADYVMVTPDFFPTLGLQLLEGRLLPDDVRADGPRVAVVNETVARQFWPGESAVGKRIGDTDPRQRNWTEVIGVVRDVGFVANFGLPETRLQVYRPLVQEPWGYLAVSVRAQHAERLAEPLRRAVAEIDPDLPLADLQTIGESVDNARRNLQVANDLLAGFAALGLALAAIGLYGVISTLVIQRTTEFGIRLALGAQPRDVQWFVLRQSLGLAAAGVALGLVGAAGLVIFLSRRIPGLPGADPLALAGTVGLLFAVVFGASLVPARRATRVDPLTALRAE